MAGQRQALWLPVILAVQWRGAKLAAMVDGTAERPYVYRQLVPMMITGVITVIG